MDAPLEGVRVLDLTNVLAGPFCTFQLALLGADVIKVEVPGSGDLARQLGADPALNRALMGASFLAQNAGKRSVTINLKDPDGRKVFERLVVTADVLVENFRPGVMARLGLGYDRLSTLNPDLIYCAISGFGQDGPLSANPAYDQIIQGLAGVMDVTGDERSGPLRVGFPVCDTVGGLAAAFAIVSALRLRQREGRGCLLDVSMLEATLVSMGWVVSNYLIAGEVPRRSGNENFTASPSGTFRTGEGLLNIAANKQEQFEVLCREIGRPDLVTDPRFVDREARLRHRRELTAEVEAALARRSAAEWEERLNRVGVPAGRVLSVPEALAHPQVTARRLVQCFDNVAGIGRDVAVTTTGVMLSGRRPEASTPPPRLGEHTDEVLQSLGLTAEEIAALRRKGAI
ncbi:MAG: CaiB/BaiF CoA-transferase family protein [Armatimonadota bacterium]|nr:CaiB/BaiF CoA-transferase family protein [Armatimonadota bacterium]MDR7451056.1 CaiB/BaiF CoA-transferase family protein [Armatimonadota bacterium]MDR7465923.1 CaiB/BaiF CoA-transferase family protein [Armatimonadota bacterium]MDR7493988.1 CaiB/BaiF CoA-transferase family protein [Armatimonadota bacterium]MDR7498438.1 CaiB/BaiF CoA-transferase family protein [Armatimonadota bacterium]